MIEDLKAATMSWRQEMARRAAEMSLGESSQEELPGQHRPLLNERGTHTSPSNTNPPGTTYPPVGGSAEPLPAPQTSYTGHRGPELPPRAAADSGYASLLPKESAKGIASFPPIEGSVISVSDLPDHISVGTTQLLCTRQLRISTSGK